MGRIGPVVIVNATAADDAARCTAEPKRVPSDAAGEHGVAAQGAIPPDRSRQSMGWGRALG
jgi:hypothetical protein